MSTTRIAKPSAPRAYGKAASAPRTLRTGVAKGSASSGGHRYRIGDAVTLAAGFGYGARRASGFQIVALLPSNGAHYQYRLRNPQESFERVAAENELTPRAEPPGPDAFRPGGAKS